MDRIERRDDSCLVPEPVPGEHSPSAVRALLEAGYPAEKILYYQGGMHDRLTLGLPVAAG